MRSAEVAAMAAPATTDTRDAVDQFADGVAAAADILMITQNV
jgi:hypothetical protein